MADQPVKFTFQLIGGRQFPSLEENDIQDCLVKWGLSPSIKAQMFSFDQFFQPYEKDQFVVDFFRDPVVINNLQVFSSNGWCSFGIKANKVTADIVPCSVMSMSFFDRFYETEIVHENGCIKKCFDDFYENFIISDELRKVLLLEDSENYDIFSESEREEFLFCLFEHVCLGGQVCQYEDSINPYLDATKSLYKDLISVRKITETKELDIVSTVYQVTAYNDDKMVYPSDEHHRQNFSYLTIDPFKRHVIVLYHRFI